MTGQDTAAASVAQKHFLLTFYNNNSLTDPLTHIANNGPVRITITHAKACTLVTNWSTGGRKG